MLYSVKVTCDIVETVDASSPNESIKRAIEVMNSKMKYTVMKVKDVYVTRV